MRGDEVVVSDRVNLTAIFQPRGVILPSWMAIALVVAALAATLSFLLAAFQLSQINREIRVLQLHAQDIESVLIAHRVATRSDFAAWESDSAPAARAPKP